nr:PilN domain-containing protein [Cupriavidus gilardii]
MAAVAGTAVLAGGYLLDRRIAAAEAENRALAERARRWEAPAREAEALRQQIGAVSRRGSALDTLLQNRGRPARLLDALASHVPRGIQLRSVGQRDDTVTIEGVARGHERVAALMRELEPAPWLARVDLLESRTAASGPGAAGGAVDRMEAEPRFDFAVRLVHRAFATAANVDGANVDSSGASMPAPARDGSPDGAG